MYACIVYNCKHYHMHTVCAVIVYNSRPYIVRRHIMYTYDYEAYLSDMEHCVNAEGRKKRNKVLKTQLSTKEGGNTTD